MSDTNTSENTIDEIMVSKKLQLSVTDGVTANGAAKLATKSFANINPDAEKEALHDAAVALASLFKNDLAHIYHSEKFLLENVEVRG